MLGIIYKIRSESVQSIRNAKKFFARSAKDKDKQKQIDAPKTATPKTAPKAKAKRAAKK